MTLTIAQDVDRIPAMTFADKLTQLEKDKGYIKRRQALAEELGVSKSTLGRWFSGQATPSMGEALKLARLMGVTMEYLADDRLESPPAGEELTETERAVLSSFRRSGLPSDIVIEMLTEKRIQMRPTQRP